MKSGSMEQFVEKLPRDLSEAAAPALTLYERHRTTAFMEMAIESAYWRSVGAVLRGLPAEMQRACSPPLLHELRTGSVLAVLRSARNYQIRWESLLESVRIGGGLSPYAFVPGLAVGFLRRLYDDPSPQNVSSLLPGVKEEDARSLTTLEDVLWQQTFRIANAIFYSAAEGPGVVIGYYYVRRNELKNLTRLAEALHYGSPFRSLGP